MFEFDNADVDNEIIEDSGTYGGIHFVSINDINLCADSRNTFYGDKIALIKTICGEVYYEYMDGVFVWRKVYVEKVMYMDRVETWKYLSCRFKVIKDKMSILCQYLGKLDDLILEKDYSNCMKFLKNIEKYFLYIKTFWGAFQKCSY